MPSFRDRRDAGAQLGRSLTGYAGAGDLVVLGLPRGGVPVAYEVAVSLGAPLDVLVVRKLGLPGYEEVAMGAIASGGIQVVDRHLMRQTGVTAAQLRIVVERERQELERRERLFRGDRPVFDVSGKTAIVVDDGLATGSTMLAAITALRLRGPARIVIAVPVAASEICNSLRTHVDDIRCLSTPDVLDAVGDYYDDFAQTTDDEVRDLLDRARALLTYRGDHGVSPPSDHRYRDPAARRAE